MAVRAHLCGLRVYRPEREITGWSTLSTGLIDGRSYRVQARSLR